MLFVPLKDICNIEFLLVVETLRGRHEVSFMLLTHPWINPAEDAMIEFYQLRDVPGGQQIHAVRESLIYESIPIHHVLDDFIRHRVTPRVEHLVDLRKLTLHVVQRLRDRF